jgi:hypothetical protein
MPPGDGRSWLGAGILDRIKRYSGHRIRIRKPIHTRAEIAPPGPSFGLGMMLADSLRLIVRENRNVHAIDVAWL